MKKVMLAIAAAASMTMSASSIAAQGGQDVNITRVMTDAVQYGRCAAELSKSMSEVAGINCPGNWVTFACNNLGGIDPVEAKRMYNMATLALVTGKMAHVVVLDELPKQDGFCVVRRIDILNK